MRNIKTIIHPLAIPYILTNIYNVQCSNKLDTLKFIPFYRSNTITKLITRNNQGPPTPPLKKTNLIYLYECLHSDCKHRNDIYIGMTTTTSNYACTLHPEAQNNMP